MYEVVIRVDGEKYVLRGEPYNSSEAPFGEFVMSRGTRFLVRLFKGDHSWKVMVRRIEEDPYGDCLYWERVANARAAREAMGRIELAMRAGTPPWAGHAADG